MQLNIAHDNEGAADGAVGLCRLQEMHMSCSAAIYLSLSRSAFRVLCRFGMARQGCRVGAAV